MSFNPNITVDIVNNNLDKNWNNDFLKINYGRNAKYFFENNYYKKYEITLELYETYENIKFYEKEYGYKKFCFHFNSPASVIYPLLWTQFVSALMNWIFYMVM